MHGDRAGAVLRVCGCFSCCTSITTIAILIFRKFFGHSLHRYVMPPADGVARPHERHGPPLLAGQMIDSCRIRRINVRHARAWNEQRGHAGCQHGRMGARWCALRAECSEAQGFPECNSFAPRRRKMSLERRGLPVLCCALLGSASKRRGAGLQPSPPQTPCQVLCIKSIVSMLSIS